MNDAQREQVIETLMTGATNLRKARLPGSLAADLERLAGEVDQPSVLAVVGRMKAGKSTFINALLGEEVAKVGVTETTATINRFRYGTPPDPARPVRCYWRGGRFEDVSRDFLDDLQGSDSDILRRAEGIDYLEYLLLNPYLRDTTLVDTPGTATVVDEHQNRTAEFLNLQRQLRDHHSRQTQRIGSEADAVIYLIGQVPRSTDQAFLEEFGHATGRRSRALNAIGMMAKIDLQPEILGRRKELAAKISEQLKSSLNTVLPVSAGIQLVLNRFQENSNRDLVYLMSQLRQVPLRRLHKLLDSDELYELDFDDCPLTADERRNLRGDMPWTVFTTIARLAAETTLDDRCIVQQLEELAGFKPLKEVLERHFFKRARFLRCHRILNDARTIVDTIRFRHAPEFRKRDREDKTRRERFLSFIRSAQGDPSLAKELEEFISLQCGTARRADRLEATVKDLDRQLGRLFHEMEEYNADFEALEQLEKTPELFPQVERDELQALLGLYGIETEKRLPYGKATVEYAAERQQFWMDVGLRARDLVRGGVAERARARYGLILSEMMGGTSDDRSSHQQRMCEGASE